MQRVWRYLSEYSILLILGAILGLAWANLDPASYHALVEHPLLVGGPIGEMHVDAEGHAHRILTVHFLVNDILMALFFAIAGKEVWEAVALRTGSLRLCLCLHAGANLAWLAGCWICATVGLSHALAFTSGAIAVAALAAMLRCAGSEAARSTSSRRLEAKGGWI